MQTEREATKMSLSEGDKVLICKENDRGIKLRPYTIRYRAEMKI